MGAPMTTTVLNSMNDALEQVSVGGVVLRWMGARLVGVGLEGGKEEAVLVHAQSVRASSRRKKTSVRLGPMGRLTAQRGTRMSFSFPGTLYTSLPASPMP